MRNLVFKNLSSKDRSRKVLVSTESFDKSGIHTYISRHLICLIKEVTKEESPNKISPSLYILKERNNQTQKERFIFRLKGSIYTVVNGRLYLISFLHSFRIKLSILKEEPLKSS
ncbi:MAG: hypothetical protein NC900_01530 [Candidatus Omnitrophica bacterium]|nr:hypothetical protein [Candidatus Omnitrophota bacterium]